MSVHQAAVGRVILLSPSASPRRYYAGFLSAILLLIIFLKNIDATLSVFKLAFDPPIGKDR